MVRPLVWSLVLLAAHAASEAAWSAQHLVRAGDEWSKLQDKLQPGDEIVLMPGKHRPAAFEGIAGTAEKPISIRSVDPRNPVIIEATDVGLSLEQVKHIRVSSVVIVNARRCGVLVRGTAAALAEDVELSSVYVAKTGDLAERAGIRIEFARDVRIINGRVESWHRAGVHIHASERIRLERVQFVGAAATPEEFGVAIDGISKDVVLTHCRFGAGVGTVLAIGLGTTDAAPPLPQPAAGTKPEPAYLASLVTVDHCVAERPGKLVTFGSCRDVRIEANTVSEPTHGYEVAAPPRGYAKVSNAVLIANLFAWTPGALKRFSLCAPDVDPSGLALEANLWWSAELAAGRSLLGDFAGELKSPQVLDVDPRLDGYLKPLEERAKAFGTVAP